MKFHLYGPGSEEFIYALKEMKRTRKAPDADLEFHLEKTLVDIGLPVEMFKYSLTQTRFAVDEPSIEYEFFVTEYVDHPRRFVSLRINRDGAFIQQWGGVGVNQVAVMHQDLDSAVLELTMLADISTED